MSFVPGLYKIFDEILVNANDNKVRDPTMTTLRVDIDAEQGVIRVYNDGNGKAVQVDPRKLVLKARKTKLLKLICNEPHSNVAFNFNLRHYTMASRSSCTRRRAYTSPSSSSGTC